MLYTYYRGSCLLQSLRVTSIHSSRLTVVEGGAWRGVHHGARQALLKSATGVRIRIESRNHE